MLCLIDTGVSLRLLERSDPHYEACRMAIIRLRTRGDHPVASLQNIAEFWNVSTRPPSQRGGFGLSIPEVTRHLGIIERLIQVLPDKSDTYQLWLDLVTRFQVKGIQVHDARLVAWMHTQSISNVVTLNKQDLLRYPGIVVQEPAELIQESRTIP